MLTTRKKELFVDPTREACAEWEGYDEEKHDIIRDPITDLWSVYRKSVDRTIRKAISRETRTTFGHYNRRLIVGLIPGDVIEMRLKGKRLRYSVEIEEVYKWMARCHAAAARAKKRADKKARKVVRR